MNTIVSPINSINELYPLYEAGAREFYFGYLDPDWVETYDCFTGNRRENYKANFVELNDVKELVSELKKLNVHYAVTFNDRYTSDQYDMLKKILFYLVENGVNRMIVADVGLVLCIREWGIPVDLQISTGGGTFNHNTVNFYKNLGIKRIIFPRQLQIAEINKIVEKNRDLEYEIFGMYGRDPYIDAFCRFHHGLNCMIPGVGACGCERLNNSPISDDETKESFLPYQCLNNLYVDGCLACGLLNLNMENVQYYKIVGRAAKTARKLEAVRFMTEVLSFDRSDSARFVQNCKEYFKEIYGSTCSPDNCYYHIED